MCVLLMCLCCKLSVVLQIILHMREEALPCSQVSLLFMLLGGECAVAVMLTCRFLRCWRSL